MTIRSLAMQRANSRVSTVVIALCVAGLAVGQQPADGFSIEAATWDTAGRLIFPSDADRWIAVGSGIGGEYNDEPFDPENPGTIGVVRMQPDAYDYFLEHGEYADGTMFLLSFYAPLEKPEPELPGFMQGRLLQREIHIIDRRRFPDEGRAFFIYRPGAAEPPAAMPPGSSCFVCHSEHGDLDATFVQFYPLLRDHVVDLTD